MPGSKSSKRVAVYVDGFNLYYGALKDSSYKWLNLDALSRVVIPGHPAPVLIRYFTARVHSPPWDHQKNVRQNVYLRALNTLPNLEIHYGKFMVREASRPLSEELVRVCSVCGTEVIIEKGHRVSVVSAEEKGSDVNLATYLLLNAMKNVYDEAWVISNDSDLAEPIRVVREELGKSTGIILYGKDLPAQKGRKQHISWHLVRAAGGRRIFIHKRHLKKALFPDELEDEHGRFRKPSGW